MSRLDDAAKLLHQYFFSWKEGRWDDLRAALAPDVQLEVPELGRFQGADQVVAVYRDGRRFPGLTDLALRRVAHNEDLAFVSYDAYLDYRDTVTGIDQLSIGDGAIFHILSVASKWPPT
jgi:hypothetical protein